MNVPSFLKGLLPRGPEPSITEVLFPKAGGQSGYPNGGGQEGVKERAGQLARADNAALAPWPAIDRYPVILGSNVSLAYISSVFRLSLTGYRREFCDLLDELLERDPHMYAVTAQRVHAVAGGEVTFASADCDEKDQERADEIRQYVEQAYAAVPDMQQSLSQLQWGGVFYGAGASELSWRMDPGDQVGRGWKPARLHFIHSRRLAYPDPGSWQVRVWDQGMVSSWDYARDPTSQLFGLACDDYPGKFIVHAPSVRGNYPTRDGLGREMAYWSALKLMGARGAAQYIERFGKPWVVGTYATGEEDGQHRAADDEDKKALERATVALGVGSLSSAVLPDSAKVELFGPGSNGAPGRSLLHAMFIDVCNKEMSKAALGQTDTTDSSPNGSRASTEVRKHGTQELYRYDAACLADTLQRGLVHWIVALNFPGELHLCPTVAIQAVEEPDLDAQVERACKLAAHGAPVDADEIGEEVGVRMIDKPEGDKSKEQRRLYPLALLKPYEVQDLGKLDRGEELEPPPKLTDPFAEAGAAAPGGSSAEGAAGKSPFGKGAKPAQLPPEGPPEKE